MATSLFSLLQGGAQEDVRKASRTALTQRLGSAQGAISSAVSGGGVNPLAAARQVNEATLGERAANASALQRSLAAARQADAQGISDLVGAGLNTAAGFGATMMGGPAAGKAASAATGALKDGVSSALQKAVAPEAPAPAPAPAQAPFQGFMAGLPGGQMVAPGISDPLNNPHGVQSPSNAQQGAGPTPAPSQPLTTADTPVGVLAERDGMGHSGGAPLGQLQSRPGVQAPQPQVQAQPQTALAQSIAPRPQQAAQPQHSGVQMANQAASYPTQPFAPSATQGVMDHPVYDAAQYAPAPVPPPLAGPTLAGPTGDERIDAARRADFNQRMMGLYRGR